jgi:hypothetical protein
MAGSLCRAERFSPANETVGQSSPKGGGRECDPDVQGTISKPRAGRSSVRISGFVAESPNRERQLGWRFESKMVNAVARRSLASFRRFG